MTSSSHFFIFLLHPPHRFDWTTTIAKIFELPLLLSQSRLVAAYYHAGASYEYAYFAPKSGRVYRAFRFTPRARHERSRA